MIAITVNHLSKYYGITPVFEDISFTLPERERLGIVGPNGAGKTTLLRIISGKLSADAGAVSLLDRLEVGYLQQEGEYEYQGTPYEEMRRTFDWVFEIEGRMREIEHTMGEIHLSDPAGYQKLSEEYARLTDRFEQANGYGFESAIMGVLRGLGFDDEEIQRPARTLSGGQQSRLALGAMLLRRPDILLLDEPTNHLDIKSIAWLEDYIRSYHGTVVIVSHDRYFLDAVCTCIAEIALHKLTMYQGNYSQYVVARDRARELQQKNYELNRREIQRQEEIIAMYKRFNREKSLRAARSREKALAKMERVERPQDAAGIRFSFEVARRTGEDVLLAEDLSKDFGTGPLFERLDMHVRAGDRVGIVGRNGIGKTTLLRILTGELLPTTGAFRWGTGTEVGYYDQKQAGLNPDNTALDEIWNDYPSLDHQTIRDRLAAFLFRGDDIEKMVGTLSGGEKGRLALLKLLLGNKNVLLLDEPTNHLDYESCQVLEDALLDFHGTTLFVSHDRYFINRIATRIFEMRDDGFTDYPGNWDAYLNHQQLENRQDLPGESDGQTRTMRKKQERQSREKEAALRQKRRAVKDAEDRITQAEQDVAALEEALTHTYEKTPDEIATLSRDYASRQAELDALMHEWERAVEALSAEEQDGR
ncbi:MAG: ABC-F family ATP-binding cassette domain-containing protein [Eubacteriales bacterium]|nr:ABC-F family ATP-binding cassette domain-containing protein [Eubacteriales bacterium]